MARRGSSPRKSLFWPICLIVAASLCAGGVAAWVTAHNVTARANGGTQIALPGGAPPALPAGNGAISGSFTPNMAGIKKMNRAQLEAEVARLNSVLADRNQQIDELQIQLKLATEGSRTQGN